MTTELSTNRPTGSPVAVNTSAKFDHSHSVGMMVNMLVALVASVARAIETMSTNGTKNTAETTSSTAYVAGDARNALRVRAGVCSWRGRVAGGGAGVIGVATAITAPPSRRRPSGGTCGTRRS